MVSRRIPESADSYHTLFYIHVRSIHSQDTETIHTDNLISLPCVQILIGCV